MGKLISLDGVANGRNANSSATVGASAQIHELITNSLPFVPDLVRNSKLGIAVFLRHLLEKKWVTIGMDEEALSKNSIMAVIAESGESWEMPLGEFIRVMSQKPESYAHENLEKYLEYLFERVGIKYMIRSYSPHTEKEVNINLRDTPLDLTMPCVGITEEGRYHLTVQSAGEALEKISIFPEAFLQPTNATLLTMLVEYIYRIQNDYIATYTENSQVEILQYVGSTLYRCEISLGDIYGIVIAAIDEEIPLIKNHTDVLKKFEYYHKKKVIHQLKPLDEEVV